VKNDRYLIVGGTTRAATTSLFLYLSEHPDVCASNVKETRFFLDVDYPMPSKYRFEDGVDKYETYFNHCGKQPVRLDATPDYLYSPGTPSKMKSFASNVKVMFILRDPIDRLVSWYRFAKQLGRLSTQCSLEEYIDEQLRIDGADQPQHMRALEQGRYSVYLQHFFDVFEPHDICVLSYNLLKNSELRVMRQVCSFAELDASFYDDYDFRVFNRSRTMKNVGLIRGYVRLRDYLRLRLSDRLFVKTILRPLRRKLQLILFDLNSRQEQERESEISPSVGSRLKDYYGNEREKTARLLGQSDFSW
jgi:hypothetical protein